jgi:CheY-like chemotaxis protein
VNKNLGGVLKLRIFVVDPNDAMREPLSMHIESLGHEVIAATSHDICPHYHDGFQKCSQLHSCGDAIILGQDLPLLKGIDFIERRVNGGCKGVIANNAIVCRPWSDGEQQRAEALGCKFFETPLRLADVTNWLNDVEKNVSSDRRLNPLPFVS